MRKFLLLVFILFLGLTAQNNRDYQGKQYGFGFSLAESGAAVSGYYRLPITTNWVAGLVAEYHIMRDEKQIDVPNPYNPDYTQSYNKKNNLYFFSLYGEIKKRFLGDLVDSGMRPFWVIGGGAVYALNFPEKRIEYDELTDNYYAVQPPDEFELGIQALLGFGIDISAGKDFTLSIRPQYKVVYFGNPVADKYDHSTVEVRFEFGATRSN